VSRYSLPVVKFSCPVVLAVLVHAFCLAQVGTGSDSLRAIPDSGSRSSVETGFHPSKSAWLAVGLSAAAPGVGQLYNGSYWKAPVIWALGTYWISEWIQLNKSYKDYRNRYNASIQPSQTLGDPTLLSQRNFYRDERDKFAWYLGALYALNLLDAYVSANLYDFDVGQDLGLDGRAAPRVTATIRWKF